MAARRPVKVRSSDSRASPSTTPVMNGLRSAGAGRAEPPVLHQVLGIVGSGDAELGPSQLEENVIAVAGARDQARLDHLLIMTRLLAGQLRQPVEYRSDG